VVISSYSDIVKLHPGVKHVHFRKFVSERLLKSIIEKCPKLEKISMSRYSSGRLSFIVLDNLKVEVTKRKVGRPNILERCLYGK